MLAVVSSTTYSGSDLPVNPVLLGQVYLSEKAEFIFTAVADLANWGPPILSSKENEKKKKKRKKEK